MHQSKSFLLKLSIKGAVSAKRIQGKICIKTASRSSYDRMAELKTLLANLPPSRRRPFVEPVVVISLEYFVPIEQIILLKRALGFLLAQTTFRNLPTILRAHSRAELECNQIFYMYKLFLRKILLIYKVLRIRHLPHSINTIRRISLLVLIVGHYAGAFIFIGTLKFISLSENTCVQLTFSEDSLNTPITFTSYL